MPHPLPSACRPFEGGREAVPARRLQHPLITAQGSSHTHIPICNTTQHPIFAEHAESKSHMCMQSLKIGQGLELYSLLFGKSLPSSTISNHCVWLRILVDQSTTPRLQNGHHAYCFR